MAGNLQQLPVPPPVSIKTLLYNAYLALHGGSTVEIFTVQLLDDSAWSLRGTNFTAFDQNGSVLFLLVGDGDTPPPPPGWTRYINVSYAENDSASTIAAAIVTALSGDPGFTATADGGLLTITNKETGQRNAATSNTFAITIIQQGET